MLKMHQVEAFIADVDDTLLDCDHDPVTGWHESSRLIAAREAGLKYKAPALATYSEEANATAFTRATEHSLRGALWVILQDAGVVPNGVIDREHPWLAEMIARKDELYTDILRDKWRVFPGTVEFVQKAAEANKLWAVGSTARRLHIDTFFELSGLALFIPPERIFAYENVTHPKPDPEVFNLAFDSLARARPRISRSRVVVLEDHPRGIEAAYLAGMPSWAIASQYSREALLALPHPPERIYKDYDELTALL